MFFALRSKLESYNGTDAHTVATNAPSDHAYNYGGNFPVSFRVILISFAQRWIIILPVIGDASFLIRLGQQDAKRIN